jgi:hypothetical protein
MANLNIDDLSAQIIQELQRYTNLVTEEVEVAKKEVADQTVKELKTAGSFKNMTGRYRKGWRVKKQGNKLIVHNKTDYQLTHLLEKGHAKVGGGRVRAYPHIGPAEQRAINEYLQRVEEAIRQ